MDKDKVYRYIYDQVRKKTDDKTFLNTEWDFEEFKNNLSSNLNVDKIVTQTANIYKTLESFEYFRKIVNQGGTDDELIIKKFINEQVNISKTHKKQYMSTDFILKYILLVTSIKKTEEETIKLFTDIINRQDIVNIIHKSFNQLFDVFEFDKPEQLQSLILNFKNKRNN